MTFNTQSFNSQSFNSGGIPAIFSQEDIAINGFGLQNANIITKNISDNPQVDFQNFNIPKGNGRGFLGHFFRGRSITMELLINGSTVDEFTTIRDNLRKELKQNSILDRKVNGEFRRLTVSPVSIPEDWGPSDITALRITLGFESLEPFWRLITSNTKSFLNTTADFTASINNPGTAPVFPVIYYIFKTGISGLTSIEITINSKIITINETINDNDLLIIDGENKDVTINGSEVEYDGTFPDLNPDSNDFTSNLNGTYDVDINVIYKTLYK